VITQCHWNALRFLYGTLILPRRPYRTVLLVLALQLFLHG
jgi:hypothetical protein